MPDYGIAGLLGLVNSFAEYLRGGAWRSSLNTEQAAAAQHAAPASGERVLVFVLIDGLGDHFLARHGQGSALAAARQGRLTSVFPSTTASAVTTMLTGVAPGRHGLTGWHIQDRRFGGVLAPLPLEMLNGEPVRGFQVLRRLFPYPTVFQQRQRPATLVQPAYLANSPFTARHSRGARVVAYEDETGLCGAVVDAVTRAKGRDRAPFVYAYYPHFDGICHRYGSDSTQALAAFARVDQLFAALCQQLAGHNVDVVVSADHGFIDSPPEQRLVIQEAGDAVLSRLSGPLTGERRAAFCSVAPAHHNDFEQAMQDWLGERGRVLRSRDLLEAGWFGPAPWHARIDERIGSHTVLMAEGWTVLDVPLGTKPFEMLGVHGGVSAREMWVPLCVRSLSA